MGVRNAWEMSLLEHPRKHAIVEVNLTHVFLYFNSACRLCLFQNHELLILTNTNLFSECGWVDFAIGFTLT